MSDEIERCYLLSLIDKYYLSIRYAIVSYCSSGYVKGGFHFSRWLELSWHLLCPVMQSVVLETSLGDIQLELYWNHAPQVNIHYLFGNNMY
jgi:hypothetical protein